LLKASNTYSLISTAGPEASAIEVGGGNDQVHPYIQALDRLQRASKVYIKIKGKI
jgi:hypothetical protein